MVVLISPNFFWLLLAALSSGLLGGSAEAGWPKFFHNSVRIGPVQAYGQGCYYSETEPTICHTYYCDAELICRKQGGRMPTVIEMQNYFRAAGPARDSFQSYWTSDLDAHYGNLTGCSGNHVIISNSPHDREADPEDLNGGVDYVNPFHCAFDEWIAREGALKFMEMARLPVRAYGTEEYFHGPRQSLGELERLWHVSLSRDPRNDDIKPDHRIGVFGSTPLAWIPALVELQWLSLATAVNRGIDPDSLGR